MIVTISKDREKIGIRIGYSLPVAAAEKYRKIKAEAFQASMETLAKNQTAQAQSAILSGLDEFLRSQLPTDEEVTKWLRTWDGKCFALIHGSNNLIPDIATASNVLDQITEEEFEAFENALTAVLKGSKAAELERRERDLALKTEEWQVKLSEAGFEELVKAPFNESTDEPEPANEDPTVSRAPETTGTPHADVVVPTTTA